MRSACHVLRVTADRGHSEALAPEVGEHAAHRARERGWPASRALERNGLSAPSFAGRRRTLALCFVLALFAAAFRLPRLGEPPRLVFDEAYHVPTAFQYLQGQQPLENTHPPLAKLLIGAGIYYFRPDAWGWRLAPALAGILLAPVFFLMARRALASERAALLAASVLLLDDLYLVLSRLAMTNTFAVLFSVAAAYFLLGAASEERLPARSLLAAAFFMGLALATRWSSLAVGSFLAAVLIVARGQRLLRPRELGLLLGSAATVVITYFASFAPLLAQGLPPGQLWHLHGLMWRAQAVGGVAHPYASAWYTWPWLYRPPLFYFEPTGPAGKQIVMVMAIGNPAVWWPAVPACLLALAWGLRRRDPRALFGSAGFAVTYLGWALVPSELQFSHYFYEALPYACLCLGFWLGQAESIRGRRLVGIYLAITAGLFLFFYPVVTALPIPSEWFYHRLFAQVYPWRWFPSWY
jgi:dolichyl-phosphate-mannose-protein mannosyltransferase